MFERAGMASQPKSWKTRKVTLRRGDGSQLATLTLECLGTWTYHPSHKSGSGYGKYSQYEDDRWSVTHILKGGVAVYCITEQDARRCVEFLGNHWSTAYEQILARKDDFLGALQKARSEGALLFYFSHEKPEALQRFQEDLMLLDFFRP